MKKTVLLVVDTWMAFRDFVRGPVAAAMRKDPDVEFVLCLSSDLRDLAGGEAFHGLKTAGFNHLGGQSLLARAMYDWAKLVFIAEHPDNTFSQRTRWTRLGRKLQGEGARMALARRLRKWGLGSVRMVRWTQHLGRAPDFARLLDEIKPAAVVFSTVLPGKIEFLREARRRGIPLVLTIPTWDKPNSKGPLSVCPDWAFVWSEDMKRDMVLYHGLDPEKVLVCGTLYFDDYFRPQDLPDRATFCREHGIDPGDAILHYAMAPPAIIPCGIEMAKVLQRLAVEGAFGRPCHVLARVSPKDDPKLYEELRGLPRLTVQIPSGSSHAAIKRWLPGPDEARHRAATLLHSDVVLTFQSSMVLDACCFDRPVVNLSFDAGLDLPPWKSVARYLEYTHARPVVETGATWIARSAEDLRESVSSYLRQPSLHAANRRALVERMIGQPDGLAHKRWLQAVKQVVNSPTA